MVPIWLHTYIHHVNREYNKTMVIGTIAVDDNQCARLLGNLIGLSAFYVVHLITLHLNVKLFVPSAAMTTTTPSALQLLPDLVLTVVEMDISKLYVLPKCLGANQGNRGGTKIDVAKIGVTMVDATAATETNADGP